MSILKINQIQHNTSGSAISVIGSASTSGLGSTGTPTASTDFTTKAYVDSVLNSSTPKIQIFMIDNATATVIAAANTPVKALGTTVILSSPISLNAVDFDMPANNRLRYTGASTIAVGVNIGATIISANNTQNFGGYLFKNGVNVGNGFKQEGSIATAATIRAGYNAYGFVELTTNDFLEFFIENQTAANTLTVRQLQITIGGL